MNSTGQFFAVDRRVWAKVCSLGLINPAIAYLVLARGTLRDLRTTSWSVNAIHERTNLTVLSAKKAVQALVDGGFIEKRRGGTKPQYYLKAYEDIFQAGNKPSPLTEVQEQILDIIKQHPEGIVIPRTGGLKKGWPEGAPARTGGTLLMRGLVKLRPDGTYVATEAPSKEEQSSEWIWLPNSIVDGASDETPPIERIRQSQTISVLRLFVELYHAQSLSMDGGVNWRHVRLRFNKEKVGEWGAFDVYAFWPDKLEGFNTAEFIKPFMTGTHVKISGNKTQDTGWNGFFEALSLLAITKTIDIVPHAVTADSEEGTVLHPMAREDEGEEAERDIRRSAHAVGAAMLGLHRSGLTYGPEVLLLPVKRHIRNVSLVGLVRLRHRAKTKATAAWFERMEEWREVAERYRAHGRVVMGGDSAPLGHATSTEHQWGING